MEKYSLLLNGLIIKKTKSTNKKIQNTIMELKIYN